MNIIGIQIEGNKEREITRNFVGFILQFLVNEVLHVLDVAAF